MEIVYPCCTGLDVHKKDAKACLVTTQEDGQVCKEIRVYSTKTEDLLHMRDWLKEVGCTCIAMEATGVYWKPTKEESASIRSQEEKPEPVQETQSLLVCASEQAEEPRRIREQISN